MQHFVKIVPPVKVRQFNGDNYYLVIEDGDKVTHYFHKKHTATIEGKKRIFKQGEYDGWGVDCKHPKAKSILKQC